MRALVAMAAVALGACSGMATRPACVWPSACSTLLLPTFVGKSVLMMPTLNCHQRRWYVA